MKELANKIKRIIGLKAYNRFIVRNPGIENLRWIINSGVTKTLDNKGKRMVFVESESQRWWIFFNDFFIPMINYYFSKDKAITHKLIMAFCEKWRTYQGTSLAFWAQALDENFLGDTNDLLLLFPEPEKSLLRKLTEFRLERIESLKI